jgi:protein-disulfide isomerase
LALAVRTGAYTFARVIWASSAMKSALRRGSLQGLCAVILAACGTAAPTPAAAPSSSEIDLEKPAKERPAWPAGLVPCPKDAPAGSSCAVTPSKTATKPEPSDQPGAAGDETVWRVPVGPDDPARGPADALVTLVVFSDFECPFCKHATSIFDKLLADLPGDVRLVWKDLPLPRHAYAEDAAELARLARERHGDAGFWKAHDLLYEAQDHLGETTFRRIADDLGLGWATAQQAMRGAKYGGVIQADIALSDRVLVEATPTTFVNGIKLKGAQPYERVRALVDGELTKARRLLEKGTPRPGLYAAIMARGTQIEPRTDTVPP